MASPVSSGQTVASHAGPREEDESFCAMRGGLPQRAAGRVVRHAALPAARAPRAGPRAVLALFLFVVVPAAGAAAVAVAKVELTGEHVVDHGVDGLEVTV